MQVKDQSLTQSAYSYLKERILSCNLYPGTLIKEKEMLEEMNISRTPFREALLQLQQENLVEIRPRTGIYVKPITKTDVYEVYSIRKLIEAAAVIDGMNNLDLGKMVEMDEKWNKLLATGKPNEIYNQLCDLDLQFHLFLVESTKNERLICIFKKIMLEAYRISVFNALERDTLEPFVTTASQHKKIIDAILCEDEKKIKHAFNYHLNYFLSSASNCVKD